MGSRSAASSSLAREVPAKDEDFDLEPSDSSDDDEAEAPASSSSPAAAEASKLYLRRLIELGVQDLEDPRLFSFLQEESEIVIGTWIQQLLIEHGFLNEFEDIDAEHNLDQGDEDTDSEDDNGRDQLEEWLDLRDRIECGDLATLQELNEKVEEEERELGVRTTSPAAETEGGSEDFVSFSIVQDFLLLVV